MSDGNPATPDSGETVEESLDVVGSGVKVLLHAINDLERHGIDASIPLPTIIVVGDQSAGKLSLIEAIIRLLWRRPGGGFEEDGDHPLFPWVERENQTVRNFATIFDKAKLEDVIRLAQSATLNPQDDPRLYDPKGFTKHSKLPLNTVQFSPNLISLQIVAPGLPNLSLYDLPGVISQIPHGEMDYVQLVENLVTEYVRQDNSLVLLTVPMKSDIENSKASYILNKIRANDRCIGVLTKPNRLPHDARADVWARVLQGKEFVKKHGYYAVKQPTQAELERGISHAEARDLEMKFFESPQWTSCFRGAGDRVGTGKLQMVLSEKLAQLILNSLPGVTEKVQSKLGAIEAELAHLPDPPPNAVGEVHDTLRVFCDHITECLDGSHQPNELWSTWKSIKKDFANGITALTPALLVNTATAVMGPPSSVTSTPRRNRTVVVRRDVEPINLLFDSEMSAPSPAKRRGQGPGGGNADKSTKEYRRRFPLTEIKDVLDSYCASGLPNQVEPKAKDALILSTLQGWPEPTDLLVAAVHAALEKMVLSALKKAAGEWNTTQLYRELRRLMRDEFLPQQVRLRLAHAARRMLHLEQCKPITEDEAGMSRAQDEARYKAYFDDTSAKTGKVISEEERNRLRQKDQKLHELLEPDEYAREVDVMAEIRGYYVLAATRFVENFRQAVEADLFVELSKGLLNELRTGLRLDEPDYYEHCQKLFEDDPARADRRRSLKDQKTRLEQANARLQELNERLNGHSGAWE
ncbi:P-loop containing nucleoside triphosphate hydrolase protein [Trichodelitschia bisporula]|uniref:P-loop containing nucleoside triphosphate hydrolase protein n=1 Tax=Trichodelitschia bisporula TaxID=703511 RepID=A0A6G1HLV6_9PEZI|nr:P-loop containing nucleoside triphosphate hydrolase protein [Trichodelitschia bisporula]